jgi:hypothetical protein
MAISNIPGVGPTNADIATAVAAPSAATIAAAVAAPSAATIASTVAAPSSATIASAVAAAVPTIGAINTSVANNAPSPFGWTLVGTITANYTSGTLTFSGLSGYKSYRMVIPFLQTSGSHNSPYRLRVNGDSTSGNYGTQGQWYSGTQGRYLYVDTFYQLADYTGGNSSQFMGVIEIHHCNLAGNKYITSDVTGLGNSSYQQKGNGYYRTTSTVTSLTLTNADTGTYGNGNVIYLYGAN